MIYNHGMICPQEELHEGYYHYHCLCRFILLSESGIHCKCRKQSIFVHYRNNNDIVPFRIDPLTGDLAIGTATHVGNALNGLTIGPLGRFIYAADSTDHFFAVYSITASGDLAFVESVAANAPQKIAADPFGRFVYLVDLAGSISSFSIIPATGILSFSNSVADSIPDNAVVDRTEVIWSLLMAR